MHGWSGAATRGDGRADPLGDLLNSMDADSHLRSACVDGDIQRVSSLLGSDPPINSQCPKGYTPLHLAASCNRSDIVDLLLGHNADPNIADLYGNGPLWGAIVEYASDPAVITSLLAAGADPFQTNVSGRTPSAIADHPDLNPLFADIEPAAAREDRPAFDNPNCPDCDAPPDQLHEPFCLQERCPFCSQQLPTCDCILDVLQLTDDERVAIEEYVDDSIEPLRSICERWFTALEQKGRIPW